MRRQATQNNEIPGCGFHHVAIRTADWDRSPRFWREAWASRPAVQWGEAPRRACMLDTGDGNYLEIFERDPRAERVPSEARHPAPLPPHGRLRRRPGARPRGRRGSHDGAEVAGGLRTSRRSRSASPSSKARTARSASCSRTRSCRVMNLGFVDHHLNNFHANKFLALLHGPLADLDARIVSAWESDPVGEDWCVKNGVARAGSAREVAEACDAVLVLAPDNVEAHPALCRQVFPSGKRCLVGRVPGADPGRGARHRPPG